MALIKTAPEWLEPSHLDFLNYLVGKAQHFSAPLTIKDICREFKKSSNSNRTTGYFNNRICVSRGKFHTIDELDTDTKVKMMFIYRAPVDREFIDFLRENAVVEVDHRNRIIEYQNNQGLQLSGYHTRNKSNAVGLKLDEESEDESGDYSAGNALSKREEQHVTQTSRGRIARKRTFFNYDEFLVPRKVLKKTDAKRKRTPSRKSSPAVEKNEKSPSQKSPGSNKTKKSVHFATNVTICSYDVEWDSCSDDISLDAFEELDICIRGENSFYKRAKKTVRFDPTVTVFPIPIRGAIRSFDNMIQKSVRFAEKVSVHSYDYFSDSSSDSGVDDFDGFDENIDSALNCLQVHDAEKEEEVLDSAEPVNVAIEMISPREFTKIFENMVATFNIPSLNVVRFDQQEEIILPLEKQKTPLTNILNDFINTLKRTPENEQRVPPNAEMTSLKKILLVLRAIIITLNSPNLGTINLRVSKTIDELQETDLIIEIETLKIALESLHRAVQEVCTAKTV